MPPSVWCVADGECPDSERCRQGLCSIESDADEFEYAIRIVPPNRDSVPAQTIAAQPQRTTNAQLFASSVEPLRAEFTTVNGEPAPDGSLILRPTEGPSSAPPIQGPVRNGEVEAHVMTGEYRLQYVVDSSLWPEIHIDPIDVAPTNPPLDIQIPRLEDLRVVTGTMTRNLTDLIDIITEPVDGANIVAVGVNTGYRSNFASTDEDGAFELRLPPGDDRFDLLIFPGDDPFVPHLALSDEIDENTEEIELSLGEFDLDARSLRIELTAESQGQRSPQWEDYGIELRRDLALGELRMAPSIDESGVVDFELLSGGYEVDVIAPPGRPWRSTSTSITVIDSLGDVEIELPKRPRVTGQITDATGEPLKQARLDVLSTGAPHTVVSDAQGQFELWLDAGEHTISVRPPADTGLPRFNRQFSIDSQDLSLELQAPRPFVVTGSLATTDDSPVAHALLYLLSPDDETVIATGHTDSDGRFRIPVDPDDL